MRSTTTTESSSAAGSRGEVGDRRGEEPGLAHVEEVYQRCRDLGMRLSRQRRMVLDLVEPNRRLAGALWPAEREESRNLELAEGAFRFEFGSPVVNLAILTTTCLALGCWRYARTEYESRNRD